MSGFYNTQTFKQTYHHKSDISRESGTKWETEDLAISHGRKLPGCVGVTYNHNMKSAYFHNKIRKGNIRNSNNTCGTRKWRWHSLTIFEQRGATNFSPEPEPVPASKEKVSRKDGGGDTASISEDDQVKIDKKELDGMRTEIVELKAVIVEFKDENAELKKKVDQLESVGAENAELTAEIVKLKAYIADYVVGGAKPTKTRTHKKSDSSSGDESPKPQRRRFGKERLTFSTEEKKIMSSIVEAGGAHHPIQYEKRLCSYTIKRGFGKVYYSTLKEAVDVMMKNQKCQERNGAFVKSREGWTIRSFAEAEGKYVLTTNNRLWQGGEEWVGFSADTNHERMMAHFKFKQIYDKIDFEDTTADEPERPTCISRCSQLRRI